MKTDGGPAFPTLVGQDNVGHGGISIRDYFASAALQGIIANPNGAGGQYHKAAQDAYAHADAMLKAREAAT